MNIKKPIATLMLIAASFGVGAVVSAVTQPPPPPPLSSEDREALIEQLRAESDMMRWWGEYYAYGPTDRAYYNGMAVQAQSDAYLLEHYRAANPSTPTARR